MTDELRKQSKLRELYAHKAKLTGRLDELTKNRNAIDVEVEEVNTKLAGVLRGIEHIENRQLLITAHAIERYRERINPNATEDLIRAHIVTPQLLKMIDTLGNGTYPVEEFHVIIEDNKVITVLTPLEKVKPHHKITIKPQRKRSRKHK